MPVALWEMSVQVARTYEEWACLYFHADSKSRADMPLGLDWDEAERVARKGVALAMAASHPHQDNLLGSCECTLADVLINRLKYAEAIEILQGIYSRSKAVNRTKNGGDLKALESCAMKLGKVLLHGGRAAEANEHFRKCLEEPGPQGRPIIFDKDSIMMTTYYRAEAYLMQGKKEKALVLLEGTCGRSSYAGGWTEYNDAMAEELEKCEIMHELGGLPSLPLFSSVLCDSRERERESEKKGEKRTQQ